MLQKATPAEFPTPMSHHMIFATANSFGNSPCYRAASSLAEAIPDQTVLCFSFIPMIRM